MSNDRRITLMYGELKDKYKTQQDVSTFGYAYSYFDIFDKYSLIEFENKFDVEFFIKRNNPLKFVRVEVQSQNFEIQFLWNMYGYIGSKDEVCDFLNLVKDQFVPVANDERFDHLLSEEKIFGLIVFYPSI